MRMRSRTLRTGRGSALILALLAIAFAAIMAGALMRTSVFAKMTSAREQQNQQAYYVAEAGLYSVLSRIDLLDPDGVLQHTSISGPTQFERDSLGEWQEDWTYQVQIRAAGEADRYWVESLGSVGGGQYRAMASALVLLSPYERDTVDAGLHFGGLSGAVNLSQTVTSDPQGNRRDVLYHIDGSDARVYGEINLDEGHDRTTFNIWGFDRWAEPHRFYTTNAEFNYSWLRTPPQGTSDHERWAKWTLDDPFPNWADDVYEALIKPATLGEFYEITEVSNKVFHVWGPDGESDPIRAQIVRTSPNQDPVLAGTTIKGCGVLHLAAEQDRYRLGRLELTGDLTLVVDGHLVLQQDSALVTNGHRLIVIAPQHSVTFSSNANGDYNPQWSPFTGDTGTQDRFYLGDQSIIWAGQHISIEGVLMPWDRPSGAEDSFRTLYTWTGSPEEGLIQADDWGADYVGSIGLFSKNGSVKFNTIKTKGVIFGGESILGYRLRLHGTAALEYPYRPVIKTGDPEDVLGLAQLYITGSAESAFPGLGLPLYRQKVLMRKQ